MTGFLIGFFFMGMVLVFRALFRYERLIVTSPMMRDRSKKLEANMRRPVKGNMQDG